ncbi:MULTISPECIES: O-antigen ligase family protein [unclassified Paenibacillus]|uniref:O-antigen ligase family protein n=1 Tax=unclassified Paenibacillus TaxID=185978 RepID=UPI000407E146|nr:MULTISPECIES: hypothetical protein [unclassified Paenibacillus]KGP79305.1 hypothetical protein P364_0124715 [Paenibacillus sp. MAEPY2]KGP86908.1 hypothetical protein P363_0114845 [Paenibacillus sp. MAEPY1]
MQITSLNARPHSYVYVKPESEYSLFIPTVHILLIYLSIYGLISIYVDNIIIRSLKDLGMVLVAIFALRKVYRSQTLFIRPFLFILGSVIALGALNLLLGASVVTFIYGIKITFLPLIMMFTGMLISQCQGFYAFARTNLIIFILLIVGWLVQYSLGIEKLISLGFIYGVNIKNYLEGVPRLSSITYSPDGYAYALLITGLIAERTKMALKHWVFRVIIQFLTIGFLLLSTIRSALVLWVVYQVVMFFLQIRKYSKKNTLILAVTFILFPIVVFFGGRALESNNLLSISSLLDRLQTWGNSLTSPFTMNGTIGNGIGSVGAASRRTHMIGLESSNFAVDNQYFSLYEQTGWIGIIYFIVLFMWIVVSLVKEMNTSTDSSPLRLPQMALALGAGVAAASFTTNVLELFPANVFFWMFIGMAIVHSRNSGEIPQRAR